MVPTVAMLLASALAQLADPSPVAGLSETARVRLVLLPTTVTDARGRPVRDLRPSDFSVSEDGRARPIEVFATEGQAPVSLAFLLDVSRSMSLLGRLEQAKASIRSFVEVLRPGDRMGLICFADHQVVWVTPFTEDKATFLRRLDVQEAEGRTALFDALATSPGLLSDQIEGRKALILFTDGVDNASEMPPLKAVWTARHVSVPIYNLNFIPMRRRTAPRRVRDGLRLLRRFSQETGGATHAIHDQDDLTQAVEAIQNELRFQYVIGYYADELEQKPGFRRVKLETGRSGLTVRTRRGYYSEP